MRAWWNWQTHQLEGPSRNVTAKLACPPRFVADAARQIRMTNCYVYILQSHRDHRHYVGITNHLGERFERHNEGRVKSTKGRIPFSLVHFEIFPDYEGARRREKFLTSSTGRRWIVWFLKDKANCASVVELADTPA
ncbi:MAG: GIY-YIG nuclease family protein [Candidatus Omnitrophica bacterium]|nr:GIY-YIG nuclease family protein [Candidatus Omnitrophota bacterium]